MNALTLLPARVRQILYVLFGLIGIAYAATDAAYPVNPEWLDVAGRVIAALVVPFTALAATHVAPSPSEVSGTIPADDGDATVYAGEKDMTQGDYVPERAAQEGETA